jgi:hypothetical protein
MAYRSFLLAVALVVLLVVTGSGPALAAQDGTMTLEDLFIRQAKELDRKQRETMLHQIQKSVADHVLVAPLFQ